MIDSKNTFVASIDSFKSNSFLTFNTESFTKQEFLTSNSSASSQTVDQVATLTPVLDVITPLTVTPVIVMCGDGVVDVTEQCDDQNNIDGDGCS